MKRTLSILLMVFACFTNALADTYADWTSTNHENGSTSEKEYSLEVAAAGAVLMFDYQVSSESADVFEAYIGDTRILYASGEKRGTFVYSFAGIGTYTLKFKYKKDSSVSVGEDMASVTNIIISKKITSGNYVIIPINATEAVLTSATTNGTKLTVPATITEENVTYSIVTIGSNAINSSSITSITIEEGIRKVAEKAFLNCSSLTRIEFPESMTEIGGGAFSGCGNIEEIVFKAKNPTYIGDGLTSSVKANGLTIPADAIDAYTAINKTYAYICDGNYMGVSGDVKWSYDITKKEMRFTGKGNMEDYTSNWGETTAPWAFLRASLESVVFEEGVERVGSYSFYDFTMLKSVTFSSTVKSIKSYAFKQCTLLTSVTLPKNIVTVGNYSFANCTGLTSFVMEATEPESLGNEILSGLSTYITIPKGTKDKYINLNPTNLYSYDGTDFSGVTNQCTWSYDATSHTLTISGEGKMDSYESISIKENVYRTSAPWGAFSNEIENIEFGDGVMTIGSYAFCGLNGIRNVRLKSNIEGIGSGAFSKCKNLESLEMTTERPYEMGNSILLDSKARYIKIPEGKLNSYKAAGPNCAFSTNGAIVEGKSGMCDWVLNVANGTITISGSGAMGDYDNCDCGSTPLHAPWSAYSDILNTATIEDGVTTIGVAAFASVFDALTTVNIAGSVRTIRNNAFSDADGLTTIVIPEGVERIEYDAFEFCDVLAIVSLPSTLKQMDSYAFYSNNLVAVTCAAVEPPSVVSSSFNSTNQANCYLYVPSGSVEKYSTTDVWKDFKIAKASDQNTENVDIAIISIGNGTVTFNSQNVNRTVITQKKGSNLTFKITPDNGMTVEKLEYNGESYLDKLNKNGELTIENVNANGTLTVTFARAEYDIKMYVYGSGASFSARVYGGDNFSTFVGLDAERKVKEITIDGNDATESVKSSNYMIRFDAITEDHTIIVTMIEDGNAISKNEDNGSLKAWKAQGKIFVEVDEDIEQVTIYDISGKVVESSTCDGYGVMTFGVDNGIHIVKSTNKNGVSTSKKL